MDLIAIDIGNSSLTVGVFAGGELKESASITKEVIANSLPEILIKYREICGPQKFGARTVPIVVSSVNIDNLAAVEKVTVDIFNQDIRLAGRDFSVDMPVGIEDSSTLGSDRLLTALAAFQVVGKAVVIADFGTATTIDLVNDSGIFLGGVIFPGLDLASHCLDEHTSALPYVKPGVPLEPQAYGTNTEKAIQNGVYYSTIGALRELVERYATELGYWPQVVATGGYANMISQKSEIIENVVPGLCLNGLFLAYSGWRSHQESPEDIFSSEDIE